MRILFLTHRLPYAPNRGDRIRAYHLLRFLATRHDVQLLSLVHDDVEMDHLRLMRQNGARVTGVPVHRLRNLIAAAGALPGRRPLTHVLLHSSRIAAALDTCVSSTPPDLVVAYCTGMARYAMEPPLRDFPLILDMVDVDSEKWAALAGISALPKRWIFRREATLMRSFEVQAVARARATLLVSEREREILLRVTPGANAMVVGNGVDLASFRCLNPPAAEPRVIFCGVFDYGPNETGARWFAHEVWPLVEHQIPGAQLQLVGMRPTHAVRALSRHPSIEVTGAVSDVRPYLWNAAVSIAPLRVARGVQNKVLEAIAAGLPVVVTPSVFEGLPTPVRSACLTADNARSFADAVAALLRLSASARRRMADAADFSELTWAAQLSPLLDVIEAAAIKKPGTPPASESNI